MCCSRSLRSVVEHRLRPSVDADAAQGLSMGLQKSLKKRFKALCFRTLRTWVQRGELRPFSIDGDGIWFQTDHGFSVWWNTADRICDLDRFGVWEEMETRLLERLLEPGGVLVDVGANIGYFSLLAAKLGAARVISFEPCPNTHDMLLRNVAYNGFGSVIAAWKTALGDSEGELRFTVDRGPKNYVVSQPTPDSDRQCIVSVPVTTLDAFTAAHPLDRIDVLKVDIEGYEERFLRGAAGTLGRLRPPVMMEVQENLLGRHGSAPQAVFNLMTELGYRWMCVTDKSVLPPDPACDAVHAGRDFLFYHRQAEERILHAVADCNK